jgi:gentisate 1,2-dioxygenase
VIWLDALDLPLFVYLEGSYAIEAPLQTPKNRPDPSELEYQMAGLAPVRRRDRPAPAAFPMMRYPWARTEVALRNLARHSDGSAVELDYVNPETGMSCLPTMGFTAMMLAPGRKTMPPLRSASAVFHVISGEGHSIINGKRHAWTAKDTVSAPPFAAIEHEASGGPAFLIRIHDAPLQEKLGYYEERART